jgi:predicted HicB family RNase H-like nuclease
MPRPTTSTPRFDLRVDPEAKARWEAAAAAEGLTLSQWIRRELTLAAKRAEKRGKSAA